MCYCYFEVDVLVKVLRCVIVASCAGSGSSFACYGTNVGYQDTTNL